MLIEAKILKCWVDYITCNIRGLLNWNNIRMSSIGGHDLQCLASSNSFETSLIIIVQSSDALALLDQCRFLLSMCMFVACWYGSLSQWTKRKHRGSSHSASEFFYQIETRWSYTSDRKLKIAYDLSIVLQTTVPFDKQYWILNECYAFWKS